MKIRFLLPLALIAVAAWLTNEAHAGQLAFYADTSRVTLPAGTQYNLATGYNAGVQVHDSNGQSVYGIYTQTAYFYLQGSQVVGYFNITIPSPGTYSFSFPAQGGGTTRYYTTPQLIVDQGNGWFAVGGGQVSWFRGEAFPYTAPQTYTYDPYATPYPSGPSTIIKPPVNYLGFKVPIERVGHSFNLKWKAAPGQVTPSSGSAAVTGFVTSFGLGPTAVIQHLLVSAPRPAGSIDEWWILDSTAGQESVHHFEPPDANSSVLGDVWTQVSGVEKRYFATPDSRRGHSLILWANNSSTAASQNYNTVGTYSNGTYGATVSLHWIRVDAIGPVASTTAYLVDLTAAGKAVAGGTDLRAAGAWTLDPAYTFYPLVETNVTLPAREVGHKFAVHQKAVLGPESSQVYTAVAAPPNAKLNFPVAKGLRFWVTREAENGAAIQPVAPAGAKASNSIGWVNNTAGATFSAISPNPNLFPAAPNRPSWALASRPVRINASPSVRPESGRNFKVLLGDGYTTTYDAGPNSHLDPVTGLTVPAYTLGSINEWNGVAFPVGEPPLPVYEFTAVTDWRYGVTLHDQTAGDMFTPSSLENRIDWLAPWVSPTLTAPPGPTITLQLPVSRGGSIFSFARPDLADASTGHPYTALQFESETGPQPFLVPGIPPVAPIAAYTFDVFSVTLTNPTPDVPGFFPLVDLASDDPTPVAVKAGWNDLSMWFPAPEPQELQISSSRWDHVLRLCHPNGESFPIIREARLGAVSVGPGLTVYLQPYYVFSARSMARPGLPWYIEDLSTDPGTDTTHRKGPTEPNLGPTNDELIPWYHLPKPQGLTGVLSVGRRQVELVWAPAGASIDGSFKVERQLGSGAVWETIEANLSYLDYLAQVQSNDGLLHFADPIADGVVEVDLIRYYRVSYQFGEDGSTSTASNVATIAGWDDTDNDGLPDAWELQHFGSLVWGGNDNRDEDTILDALGNPIAYTNLQEFLNHTNPNALPAGAPGSTLVVYTPLQ